MGENAVLGSMAVAAMASTNILLDFFLLIGACCGVRSGNYQQCTVGMSLLLCAIW